ncbi:TetR/AcrR family transcriptional regulator [bacterium]|nr:TetR/AcrR family transcriptional regulator [bacterium]
MSKTKQKILDVARELFNELGYGQVTIRMIALKLEMSSGNLNYHFKKREEILDALYFQMVKDFDQRIDDLSEVKVSFGQIKKDICLSMERMVEYKFIWTDLYSILKNSEKIYEHFSNVYSARLAGNLFLFSELNELGFMRLARFKNEYEMLSERMINFGNTWLYTSEVYRKISSKEYIESQSKAMLATFYPYLTEEGVEEYLKVV